MNTNQKTHAPALLSVVAGSAHHGLAKEDHILIGGKTYRVESVTDACSFTLRNARWYDRLFWRLKCVWKWLTGFLPNTPVRDGEDRASSKPST
jgi:hypothetical protein